MKNAKQSPLSVENVRSRFLFKTCDAVSSGLVTAALDRGVSTVITMGGLILVKMMYPYAETLFQNWLSETASLAKVIKKANIDSSPAGSPFEIFRERSADLTEGS